MGLRGVVLQIALVVFVIVDAPNPVIVWSAFAVDIVGLGREGVALAEQGRGWATVQQHDGRDHQGQRQQSDVTL